MFQLKQILDIDLDVTEEEEKIASKLASKIDMTEDPEVVTEDNNSGTVINSVLNEASLESVWVSILFFIYLR